MKCVLVHHENSKEVVLHSDACPLVHPDASGECATTMARDSKLAHPPDKRDYPSPQRGTGRGSASAVAPRAWDWINVFACGEIRLHC
jgi:hypothetical protein